MRASKYGSVSKEEMMAREERRVLLEIILGRTGMFVFLPVCAQIHSLSSLRQQFHSENSTSLSVMKVSSKPSTVVPLAFFLAASTTHQSRSRTLLLFLCQSPL